MISRVGREGDEGRGKLHREGRCLQNEQIEMSIVSYASRQQIFLKNINYYQNLSAQQNFSIFQEMSKIQVGCFVFWAPVKIFQSTGVIVLSIFSISVCDYERVMAFSSLIGLEV